MEESIRETGPAIFISLKEAKEDLISRITIIRSESKKKEKGFVITRKPTNIAGRIVEITGTDKLDEPSMLCI